MVTGAVVIAAPGSGSGKTTVATGIMGALRTKGTRVAPFKVGPDYIDPGYHALASGRPGRNLDSVMVGTDRIAPMFRHGSADADIAVVEGVMGLFDGRIDLSDNGSASPSAEGSTALIAAAIGAPVVLVVDARGHSQSLGAVVQGFSTYDPGVRIGGVILNRVGSDRHESVLRQACERVGVPVLGCVPRAAELDVPSRHLGLITAAEYGDAAKRAVDSMSALVQQHVDLDAVVRLANSASLPAGPVWNAADEIATEVPAGPSPVVAVAGGPAFTFGYAEHAELLIAAGATVATFDPRTDRLPAGTSGIVLPGGFPEEHAAALSANVTLHADVREAAARGLPIHGECAGLLYLGRTLDGHAMAGVLDIDTEFGTRLTLGYRSAAALTDSVLYPVGRRVTGHEFHRTHIVRSATTAPAWGWKVEAVAGRPITAREGFVDGSVHASYLHTHPAGSPEASSRFVSACRAVAPAHARWHPDSIR